MSNLINFQELGGYRLEQPTFEKMQSTYYLFLKAMIGHFGIPDSGSFIISGCTIVGPNITPGIVYIDGTICEFAGSAGTLATLIKKTVTTETLEFFNGTTQGVFQRFTATVDPAGIALSDFVRVPSPFNLPEGTVIDADYIAFTAALLAKLNGIESGAQVNVIPSFTQNNPAAANYIADKPVGKLLTYLKQGVYIHGDLITSYQQATISFPDIGTTDYKVIGCIVGSGSSNVAEARVNFTIKEKTATSFKLLMSDGTDSGGQDIRFDWVIVPSDNS